MSAPRFDALVAIGDNLSIDCTSVGPHRGAASLLYRNRDSEWPEFRGRDMVTRDPAVRLLMLGQEGATSTATLATQMKRLPLVDEPVLVVITAGAKDLLALSGSGSPAGARDADHLYDTLTGVFDEVNRHFSDAYLMLGNIPAPPNAPCAPEVLESFNEIISGLAREQGAALIDIYCHFAAHAADSAGTAWCTEALDPTAEGASEIRRLLWQALQDL